MVPEQGQSDRRGSCRCEVSSLQAWIRVADTDTDTRWVYTDTRKASQQGLSVISTEGCRWEYLCSISLADRKGAWTV